MRGAGFAVLLLLTPTPGAAGGAPVASPGPDLFGGYSYTEAGEAGLHGWHVAGSYPMGASVRLVGDLSGHYGSFAQADLSQLTFMIGGRWIWAKGRLVPFAEGLVGGARTKTSVALPGGSISDSDTDWGLALGGGLDYRMTGPWAARVQIDLLVLRAEGAWESDPRLSLGVVYRIGE